MEEAFKLIDAWLGGRRLAKNTERLYRLEAERFTAWLTSSNHSISSCSKEQLETYLVVLQQEPTDIKSGFNVRRRKALAQRSIEQTRRILCTFFDWAVKTEHLHRSPMWGIHAKKPRVRSSPTRAENQLRRTLPNILGIELEAIDDEEKLRLATIVHLAFWAGASTSEIASLKIRHIRTTTSASFISLPKKRTSVGRVDIELPRATQELIQRYLLVQAKRTGRNNSDDRSLIVSLKSRSPVSGWTVCHTVRKWLGRPENKVNWPYEGLRSLRRNFIKLATDVGIQEITISVHLRCQRVGLPNLAKRTHRPFTMYNSVKQKLFDPEARSP